MALRRLVRRQGDGFKLKLTRPEQQYLASMIGDLRDLLIAESPASDAAVARKAKILEALERLKNAA